MGKGKPRVHEETATPMVFWMDETAVFSGSEVGEGAPVLRVIQGTVDLTSLADLFARSQAGEQLPVQVSEQDGRNWSVEMEYGYRKKPYAVILGSPHLVALAVAHFNAQEEGGLVDVPVDKA